jgi:ribose 5-phosphate isomerase B
MKKILLASDHAGFELKEEIQKYLLGLGYSVEDMGALYYEPIDDYPDFIRPLAERISKDSNTLGIIFGGSGQGEAMVANRIPGVRAIVFYGPRSTIAEVDVHGQLGHNAFEIVTLGRLHNDANVLSIGARFVTEHDAKEAVKLFLATEHIPDERHDRRIKKIDQH